MKTATTTKTQKQVIVIARAQFKNDPAKVCYQVRSSNGKDTYWTCLYNGVATGCDCPSKSKCYHMTQVEKLEAERTAKAAHEVQATPAVPTMSPENLEYLAQLDPTHCETAATVEMLTQYAVAAEERVEERQAEEAEIKTAVFQMLKEQFDYRLQVQPATVATAPKAEPTPRRYTAPLNGSRAFSLMR